MATDFYNAFDQEYLHGDGFNQPRQQDRKPPQPDYRTVFHQDRDRILFSPAFRRLQTKTQVFQAGEYDFYRTRLTHSLEVSRIAESLAIWLGKIIPKCKSICISWKRSVSLTTSAIRHSATRASEC